MYYLHLKDQPPERGESFRSRNEAFAMQKQREQQASHKITFVPSHEQLVQWEFRERERFSTGAYIDVPWWEHERRYTGHDLATGEALYPRFPHMSVKQPGMIAYTLSPEHGIADRQTITRPGKYLEQFLPEFSARHAQWIAECSAEKHTLKIATTADDIQRVYEQSYPSLSSCMGGTRSQRAGEYNWPRCRQHPVRAYGDSDLAVAYLGDLTKTRGITARAVVWPAALRYIRVYGDETLTALLKASGYTKGTVHGAKIRAIEEGDGWLLPYIDSPGDAVMASLSRDHQHLLLTTRGDGDFDAQTTEGCTDEVSGYSCNGCGDNIPNGTERSHDGDYWCQSCWDDRFFDCYNCGSTCDQGDEVSGENGCVYCEDCSTQCEECERAFVPNSFTRTDRLDRQRRNIHDHICSRCDDGVIWWCDDCDRTYTPNGDRDASVCVLCEPPDEDHEETEREYDDATN